jgi:regulator of protease activity HflC (stomatin/prohibitin superfamily)
MAWASLVLSLVFFGVTYFLGRWSGFFAVSAVAWQLLAAALIWLVLAIQFHQRALAEQEKLDMGQLAREKESSTIFQARGDQLALLAAAQRRLDVLEKWFLPLFAALIAAYEIGLGFYLLYAAPTSVDPKTRQQPLVVAIIATTVAFVSFLLSRYATGMSVEPRWKPLRAGGSHQLGVAVICFALALTLAGVHFQFLTPVRVVGYVIPVLLFILGVETALNVVLDIYRPRLKGQYSRAAFDSRLLGTINEPGGVFRSVAAAIDYQFGFQVSQTWFYKLLEKAIVALILFSALTLYLASCILVVAPNEQAVIERFGNPLAVGGAPRLVGPGMRLKFPWPIDIAYKYPTGDVMELHIGYVPRTAEKTGQIIPETSLLWGQSHYKEEYNLLVASEFAGQRLDEGAAPVSVVKANMPVQYRIKDLYAYIYHHDQPDKLLEDICYRELTKFAASASVETEDATGSGERVEANLLGAGRTRAKQVLAKRIQDAADREELGIEVVFLGVQGIHPPLEVAPDYEAVAAAVQLRQALVLQAEAERNRTLSTLIGSVRTAYDMSSLAAQYQRAREEGRTDDVDKLGKQLDEAFAKAQGDIFKILRDAQSYAFEKATLAKAAAERFAGQLKAYRAAPQIYVREQRLAVLEEALQGIRKYVVVSDPSNSVVVIVNLEDKLTPDLYDIGGLPENKPQ